MAAPPKNPIDMAADPNSMNLALLVEKLAQSSQIDAIIADAPLWGISPATIHDKIKAAEIIAKVPEKYGKPLICLTMKTKMAGIVYDIMRENNIPFYEFPKEAARAVYGLYMYARLQERSLS